MASAAADQLAAMSLNDAPTLSHAACANTAEWKTQLESASGLPEAFTLTKTLVFKPSRINTFSRISELFG